jgi:hypothetical protein
MDFEKLAKQAQHVLDERGGIEGVKEDAEELKGIAGEHAGLAEKAKEAAAALKVPGKPDQA